MSLLTDAMESCVMMNKTTTNDDYGGFINAWVESEATFDAVCDFDTSVEARIAEVQGVYSLYTVTTKRNVILQNKDIFKRERDGKYFQVTSDGDDKYTPSGAGLDMRQVTARELITLPT